VSTKPAAAHTTQLALYSTDEQVIANLRSYADDLEARANKLEGEPKEAPLSPQAMEATHEPDTAHAMAALQTEEPEKPD
jgi:hypothetical protein